jgi:hypothetical protein
MRIAQDRAEILGAKHLVELGFQTEKDLDKTVCEHALKHPREFVAMWHTEEYAGGHAVEENEFIRSVIESTDGGKTLILDNRKEGTEE